jgi:F0F1-type ATP synthase membrane subunit c/vacuolar-type H+-ATPase subunit K
VEAAQRHLRAYLGAVASLPGGELQERGGVLWCRTTIPWPMFNGVIASPELGACDAVQPALEALAAGGRPWFLWQLPDTPEDVLAAAVHAGASDFDRRAPWLEAEVAALEDPALPGGVTIEEVTDEAGHRLWAATTREIYGFPPLGEQAWAMPGELTGWRGLPWRQWIAFADGEPAGVTLLYCGGGVAGLFGVGTKAAARRRGIGRLLTLLPLKASGEERAGFFATAEGEALYRTLGFERRGWVSRWLGGLPS